MLRKELIRKWEFSARTLSDISLESAIAEIAWHGRLLRVVTLLEHQPETTVILWEVSPEFSYEY